MRLGVYADLVYRADQNGVSADRAFVEFVTNLRSRLEELVLFGRLDPIPGRFGHRIPDQVRFVPLPHYSRVADVPAVVRAVHSSRARFAAELPDLDAVWLFGPHPLALVFARVAQTHSVPVFLGVRQNFPKYIRERLPNRRWVWAVAAAYGLEWSFRRLARRAPAVVVGAELARLYGSGAPVLATGFSLVRDCDVVSVGEALGRSWDGDQLELLSVGRLDPEKNPLLLADVLAGLRAREPRWRLRVVGEGPLTAALRQRAHLLGLGDAIELAGYVPSGPALWALYRQSHAFLHVSLTEGLPQVLFEAQAAGLPIVATAVGGVADALAGGTTGLLIPPNDAGSAVAAVERLRIAPALRRELVEAGLQSVAHETMERQLDRLAEFFRQTR